MPVTSRNATVGSYGKDLFFENNDSLGRYDLIIRFTSPSTLPKFFFYILCIKYKVPPAQKIIYLQDFYILYSVSYRNREYT